MKTHIEFTKEECHTDFKTLYERLWNEIGLPYNIEDVELDKRYITGNYWLLKQVFNYYLCEMDANDDEVMRIFMFFGPKNISDEDGYFLEVEDGWWKKKGGK